MCLDNGRSFIFRPQLLSGIINACRRPDTRAFCVYANNGESPPPFTHLQKSHNTSQWPPRERTAKHSLWCHLSAPQLRDLVTAELSDSARSVLPEQWSLATTGLCCLLCES